MWQQPTDAAYALVTEGGRCFIPVPAGRAEELQARLRKQGIGSTVVVEPYDHQARLELWPGASPERVRALLQPAPGG